MRFLKNTKNDQFRKLESQVRWWAVGEGSAQNGCPVGKGTGIKVRTQALQVSARAPGFEGRTLPTELPGKGPGIKPGGERLFPGIEKRGVRHPGFPSHP